MLGLNNKVNDAVIIVSFLLIIGYPIIFLPIKALGEVNNYSYSVYISIIIYITVLSIFFSNKLLLRNKISISYIYIILIYTIYVLSSVIFYQPNTGSDEKFVVTAIGFLISIYSFYIGLKLITINSRKIDILMLLLMTYFIVVAIMEYSKYRLINLVQERYFIYQVNLLVFIVLWINDFSKFNEKQKILLNLAIILLLFITGSRSALLGITLYIFIKFIFSDYNSRKGALFSVIVFLLLVGIFIFDGQTIDLSIFYGNRVKDGFFIDNTREMIRQVYIKYIGDNYLIVAIGSGFNLPNIEIATSNDMFVNIISPHNFYLYLIKSIGISGLIFFVLFLIKTIKNSKNIAFIFFVLIFSLSNDILIFPSYNSQLLTMSIWYLILGLYTHNNTSCRS